MTPRKNIVCDTLKYVRHIIAVHTMTAFYIMTRGSRGFNVMRRKQLHRVLKKQKNYSLFLQTVRTELRQDILQFRRSLHFREDRGSLARPPFPSSVR